MRVAWFTPWPPQQTGVAGRSAELVPLLAARGHAIDVFVDEQRVPASQASADPPAAGAFRVLSAHDFVWRQVRTPYALTVYQVGNSRHHQFLWPYLFRYPGLAVLHDTRLHHARGHALLSRHRVQAYRDEFAWAHPGTSPDAAELGVLGLPGVFYSHWPMLRGVLEASRHVVAHARGAAAAVERDWPGTRIGYVALGEGPADPPRAETRAATRQALGLDDGAVAYGVFGGLTTDKRIPEIVEAFADAHRRVPGAVLLLAGQSEPALDIDALVDRHGIAHATRRLGVVDDERFDALIGASDVAIALRWPSAGETSGPWLRALATGRPTIIMELAQLAHVPTLDPRSMQPHGGHHAGAPVALSIDILDEVHSLALAMTRLGESPALRASMGTAAREYWSTHHTLGHMADDYQAAFAEALAAPSRPAMLPAHLRPDPLAGARALTAPFGPDASAAVEDLCGSR